MIEHESGVVLELQGITKRFPGILANDHVDLALHRGEILALLGENGAGKSTLMNIIYGLYHADEGMVSLKDRSVHFASPREAIHAGIGMVHQHFQLIPVMTVAENVTLGEENADTAVPASPDIKAPGKTGIGIHPARRAALKAWSVLWRILTLPFAILIGLLFGLSSQSLGFVIAAHLVSGPPFDSFQFDQLHSLDKAILALSALYPVHGWTATALVWLPLIIAMLVGGWVMFRAYRHARRTWDEQRSPFDNVLGGILDWIGTLLTVRNQGRAAQRVRELSKQYGLAVDPDALVEQLPVGLQQRVEIVKALYRHADILILDEPTAVLTPQESQELFRIMRSLAGQGVSIIFITHKLKEVLQVADRIVVMRGGKVVGSATPSESTESSLASMMVGRDVVLRVPKGEAHPGNTVLVVNGLSALDDRKTPALSDVNFEVRAGEVLGIAGVQGNGQSELVEALTGLRVRSAGGFSVAGRMFEHVTPRALTQRGEAHIPEDRQRYGMVSPYSVADNLVLNTYETAPYATAPSWRQLPLLGALYLVAFGVVFSIVAYLWAQVGWPAVVSVLNLTSKTLNPRQTPGPFALSALIVIVVTALAGVLAIVVAGRLTKRIQVLQPASGGITINRVAIDDHAKRLIAEYDIRTPSGGVGAGTLSGGNQQKMVVAREFSRQPRLLIASQPTRGIDVGSIEFIHRRIVQQRDAGAAVLLVSAELDEIMALSDRIAVMYRGKIVATLPAAEATREQLGLLMAGATEGIAAPIPLTTAVNLS
ncbi:MAG: ABC transporter ATP-binding protein [Aggregatilineales bacterium]